MKLTPFHALLAISALVSNSAHAAPENQGKEIIDKQGCNHCHIVEGKGSTVAPPLDGINKHRSEAYIIDKLTGKGGSSTKIPYPVPADLMSHVHTSKQEAEAMAKYLISLPEQKLDFKGHGPLSEKPPEGSHFVPASQSESSKRGGSLFVKHGCVACHSVGGTGGHTGPDLAGVGARRTRRFIVQRIESGALLLPGPGQASGIYAMPPAKLRASEREDIINWLLTLAPQK